MMGRRAAGWLESLQPEEPHTVAELRLFAWAAAGAASSEMTRRAGRMRFIVGPFVGSHCFYNGIGLAVPV